MLTKASVKTAIFELANTVMNCGKEPENSTFVAEIRRRMRDIDQKLVVLAGSSGLCLEQEVQTCENFDNIQDISALKITRCGDQKRTKA